MDYTEKPYNDENTINLMQYRPYKNLSALCETSVRSVL